MSKKEVLFLQCTLDTGTSDLKKEIYGSLSFNGNTDDSIKIKMAIYGDREGNFTAFMSMTQIPLPIPNSKVSMWLKIDP